MNFNRVYEDCGSLTGTGSAFYMCTERTYHFGVNWKNVLSFELLFSFYEGKAYLLFNHDEFSKQ